MDWKACCQKNIIKPISVDNELIKSLTQTILKKHITVQSIRLTTYSAETIIGIYYDIVRLQLEILAQKQGYKILNHECYEAFLSEILDAKEESTLFRKIRRLRNSINYYGQTIDMVQSRKIVKKIQTLLKLLEKNSQKEN